MAHPPRFHEAHPPFDGCVRQGKFQVAHPYAGFSPWQRAAGDIPLGPSLAGIIPWQRAAGDIRGDSSPPASFRKHSCSRGDSDSLWLINHFMAACAGDIPCGSSPRWLHRESTTLGVLVRKTRTEFYRQLRFQAVLKLPEFLRSRIGGSVRQETFHLVRPSPVSFRGNARQGTFQGAHPPPAFGIQTSPSRCG